MRRLVFISSLLGFLATHASSQDEASCTERDASAVIHVMICPETLSDEALAAEGKRICKDLLTCGVWFWTRNEDAPAIAPDNHDGLTAEEVQSSVGVYSAEQGLLIRIDRE